MKWLDNTALVIVIIGAVNWLLVGIFQFRSAQGRSCMGEGPGCLRWKASPICCGWWDGKGLGDRKPPFGPIGFLLY